MIKPILLTITPADYYFFGGENTFDQSRGDRNYLVHSNRLPQQTALVGLIRHILFLQDKNRIGAASFKADWDKPHPQDYGNLFKISSIFLQKRDGKDRHFLLPAPRTWLENGAEIQIGDFVPGGQGFTGSDFQPLPRLYFKTKDVKKPDPCKRDDEQAEPTKSWTEKVRRDSRWISLADGSHVPTDFERFDEPKDGKKDNGGIFISSLHIGIDKQSRMKEESSDDEGFYKQEFFRLAPGYSFAVVASIDDKLDLSVFRKTMPFGGESRSVSVEAEDWSAELQAKWKPAQAYGNPSERIVLISDAYLEPSDYEKLTALCNLVITEAKPFRHIRTPLNPDQKTLANLHRHDNPSYGKQNLLYLLERGSVLFPKTAKDQYGKTFFDKAVDLLNKATNFQNIGYNHFYPHHTTL